MATQVTNQELLAKVNTAAGNPSAILQTVVSLVEDAHGGTVTYVDPSNPAVTHMETSAVIHASSIQQHTAALRKLYPILAQTPEDLYNHMSYRDYVNRFASPSLEPFTFFVSRSQLLARAVPVDGTNYIMATIPRGTTITVNKYVKFTLQFPINIKFFSTNTLEVSYDTSVTSPLQSLSTNVIVYNLTTDANSREQWIRFTVPAPQVSVSKVTDNINAGRYFVRNIEFTDKFCMARVWYRNASTGNWVEMTTTYSPTIYDESVPTMQLKVIDNVLNASLPLVYQTTGQVIGEVRIDIYTTKGAEVINLGEYNVEDFTIDMSTLNPEQDTNAHTAAALNINMACQSSSLMSGGKDSISFEELRERVINNSVGPQDIPITNINVQAAGANVGFELVPDVDVLTNRIFMATRSLPAPTNKQLVTSANIGVVTYVTDDASVEDHPWVRNHNNRTTFLSKNLYRSDNGIIKLLSKPEVDALTLLPAIPKINNVNNNNYLYSPFYYVLDSSKAELTVRPYHLDNPQASYLDFKEQNSSLQLIVNTADYSLTKIDDGYRLQIVTSSGNFYKALEDNEVYVQLGVRLKDSIQYAFWNGTLIGKTDTDERIFQFDILTDYDIDDKHNLIVTNGKIDATSVTPISIDLTSGFEIFHITTSITGLYRPSDMDGIIGKFMLPNPCAAITREGITLEFGKFLSSLWTRCRNSPDSDNYVRYTLDIEDVAQEDIFADPPFNIIDGEVVYNYLYRKGDVILDKDGKPDILHHKGDIVYKNGVPLVSTTRTGIKEFDLLMADGRNYFVDDQAYLDYNKEFVETIVTWVTEDLKDLQARTLEKTKIYFYPKNQLATTVLTVADLTQETVSSEQSISIDAYVPDSIIDDIDQRNTLTTKIISYLSNWISGTDVSITTAANGVKDILGQGTETVYIRGLGPKQELQMLKIAFNERRLALKRILDVQQDGKFIIREDVAFEFKKANPIPLPR